MGNSNMQDELRRLREKYGAGSDASPVPAAAPTSVQSEIASLRSKYGSGSDSGKVTFINHTSPTKKNASPIDDVYGQLKQSADFDSVVSGMRENKFKIGDLVPDLFKGNVRARSVVNSIQTNTLDTMQEQYSYLTPEQQEVLLYYGGRDEWDKATDYLISIERGLNAQASAAQTKRVEEFAEKNPTAASVILPGASVLGGAIGAVDMLAQNARRAITGEAVDYNSEGQRLGRVGEQVKGAVGDIIEEKHPASVRNTNIARTAYDTVMSGAESLVAAALPGGALWLAANAVQSTARDIKNRGGSDNQALIGGVAAGVFEGLFERYSIGNLKAMKEIPAKSIKDMAKNVMKSIGVNASEELATEVANVVFDAVALKDVSNWQMSIRRYMDDAGKSEAEAKRETAKDMLEQVLVAGVSGGLMGGAFGVIGTAAGRLDPAQPAQNAAETVQERANAPQGEVTAPAKHPPAIEQKSMQESTPVQPGVVSPAMQESAQSATVADSARVGDVEQVPNAQSNVQTQIYAPGLVQNEFSAKLDQSTAKILDLLGKATGTPIVVEAQVRGGTANGSYRNGVARIAADATNPFVVVGKHEITHRMQELVPTEYRAYRDYAVRVLSAEKSGLVGQYQRNAAEQGEPLTREQALDEIAADFTEMLLTDESRLERFLTEATTQTESRSMVQKFFDAMREFLDKVRSVFIGERAKMDTAAREQFGVSLRQLEQAERRWMELVDASVRAEKNTAESGGEVRYSLGYDAAIDQLDAGTLNRAENTHLLVSDHTPPIYIVKAGAKDLPIIMGWDIAYLAMKKNGELPGHYHNLGSWIMKEIPRELERPLYIVKRDGKINAILEISKKAGRPTLISVELDTFKTITNDGEMQAGNYNLVLTAFDAKANYLSRLLGDGANIVFNKNEEDPAHFISRLKLLEKAVPENDRTKSSTNHSIHDESDSVKHGVDGMENNQNSLKGQSELMRQAAKDAQLAGMMNQGRKDAAKLRKVKETTADVRRKRDEAIKEMKQKQRDREAAMRESRNATAIRAKIQRHVNDLSAKLRNPTDKKHIPEELRGPVAKLLESINTESKNGAPTKRTQAFAELKKAYSEIAGSMVVDPDLLSADGAVGLFDEVIAMADKRISDMTTDELETVWKTIRAVEASIRTANRNFAASRYKTVQEAAQALWDENIRKKDKGYMNKLKSLLDVDMLTPEAFFHRLGSAGDAMFKSMRAAQDKHVRLMKEVSDFTHENLGDVDVQKWEKELHTVTLGGQSVEMSAAQLMELYALMRRQQAMEHLLNGIKPEVITKKGKKTGKSEAIRHITADELMEATSVLTDEQVQVAELLQEYASSTLADFGNEASMEVYGYRKFGEEHYWPIRSDRAELKTDVQKDTRVTSVANRGFTKNVKPRANNAVQIGSIFDTFASHASEMATYSAWLGTTEDINRIRNYAYRVADEGGVRTIGTVKGLLDRVFGAGKGQTYIQKLLSDIAIGVKGTNDPSAPLTSGFVGNYKAASVGANLRVVIQQPTSILRSLDVIDAKYLVSGIKAKKGFETAKKYAPIAQWKDWGYFDIHTGRQMKDVLFDSDSALEKTKEASMWLAGKMDSISWGLLWGACEAEAKDTTSLAPGSEEFYKKVAERFNEIIDHTQVVDGILQRSQIMRSGDNLTKMATSFMGEPTKQYNMMLSAIYDAKDTPAGKKRALRTGTALAASALLNVVAQSLVDAARDDDREKEYWERVLKAATGIGDDDKGFWSSNLWGTVNVANYVPYVKDVMSIVDGYDVSRMDMDSVDRTISSAKNLLKALNGKGKTATGNAVVSFIAELSRLGGIPLANLKREVTSIALTAAVESENHLLEYRIRKALYRVPENTKMFYDVLFDAMKSDKEAYRIIYKDMIASGMTEEKIKGGMEDRMKAEQGVKSVKDLKERWEPPKP